MKRKVLILNLVICFAMNLLSSVYADRSLNLIKANGLVNKSEIGGAGLYVFSLWGKKADSFVQSDGSFKTTISDSRPQKLSVKDDRGMTRALTIVLPASTDPILFDAQSTARAVFFQDAGSFRSSEAVERLFKRMDTSRSFQKLVASLKKSLISKPLEEILGSSEWSELLEQCHDEIYGENTPAMKKNLSEAQHRLEKTLIGQ